MQGSFSISCRSILACTGLASWIAPRLITFDLADDALPILLSHPISRFGYVFGKFIALFGSLSVVTWVPCLLLFVYQGYSSPLPWASSNLRIAVGLFAGAVIWIAFLSILGLALSSWVKWRVVATGTIFAAVFVPAGVGAHRERSAAHKMGIPAQHSRYDVEPVAAPAGRPRVLPIPRLTLPTEAIVTMLVLICLVCVAMLNTRIRAREVVRG